MAGRMGSRDVSADCGWNFGATQEVWQLIQAAATRGSSARDALWPSMPTVEMHGEAWKEQRHQMGDIHHGHDLGNTLW